MSRVAFLLDGFFHKFGLHGKSFIPLVTGFGCSVPAYMAARTLKNERDRFTYSFYYWIYELWGKTSHICSIYWSIFFPKQCRKYIISYSTFQELF